LFQIEIASLFIGPKRRQHDAVGAEDHDHSLLASRLIRESQTRQIQHEWQRRSTDPDIPQKFAS